MRAPPAGSDDPHRGALLCSEQSQWMLWRGMGFALLARKTDSRSALESSSRHRDVGARVYQQGAALLALYAATAGSASNSPKYAGSFGR